MNKIVFQRQNLRTTVVCYADFDVKNCQNIYILPWKLLDFDEFFQSTNLSSLANVKNCSYFNICIPKNLKNGKTFYKSNFNNFDYNKKLTKDYNIPFRFGENMRMEPIFVKFTSVLNVYYYLQEQCNKKKMIFYSENLFDNLIYFWQLSFSYEDITFVNCVDDKHSKTQKCQEIKGKFEEDRFYAYYLTCKQNISNREISLKDVKLRLNSFHLKFHFNFEYSKIGYLQIFQNGFWSNVSYFQFDSHTSNLVCKHFGHESGTLSMSQYIRGSLNNIFINCLHNVTNLKNCNIIQDFHSIFLKLKSNKVLLICMEEETFCEKTLGNDVTTVKFNKKCYFFMKTKQKLSYFQMKNECLKRKLSLITINEKEEARFIFNQIVIKKMTENSNKTKNLYELNYNINNTIIPFCKHKF